MIIFTNRYPDLGGIETFIDSFRAALKNAGVRVEVWCQWPPYERKATTDTFIVNRHPRLYRRPMIRGAGAWWRWILAPVAVYKRWDRYNSRRRLRREMASLSDDTLVVYTGWDVGAEVATAHVSYTGARGPVIVGQFHSSFDSLGHCDNAKDQLSAAFRDVDAFVALTERDADAFAPLISAPRYAIPNMRRSYSEGASPLLQRPLRAIVLARLVPEKQLDHAIRGFLRATDEPDLTRWVLDVYGSGPEEAKLRALVAAAGAQDRVHFRGVTPDPHAAFASARIHIMTSRFEGFGLTVLEAAQCSVPTVAYACSPGVEELTASLSGCLIPPDDEDQLATRLRELIHTPTDLSKRSERAREGTKRYSSEAVLRKWARMLEDIYERRELDQVSR